MAKSIKGTGTSKGIKKGVVHHNVPDADAAHLIREGHAEEVTLEQAQAAVAEEQGGTIPSDRERGDSAADIINKAGGVLPPELQTESDEDVKEKKSISKPGTMTTKGKQ